MLPVFQKIEAKILIPKSYSSCSTRKYSVNNNYHNEIRISHACRLLVEEELPVANICYTCGYSNVSYFIKQFKKITGLTPLSYMNEYADQIYLT